MEFFFSQVAGYNLTKRLHEEAVMWNLLLNFSEQFFTRATFGETFFFF